MVPADDDSTSTLPRRAMLAGGAALGVAGLVASCGETAAKAPSGPSEATGPPGVPAGLGPTLPPSGPGTVVGPATDVPVGTGKVFTQYEIVVTQPAAGQFRGFSTECTHAGCQVVAVVDQLIQCPCHGSRYHLDGSVAHGPATRPLEGREITVTDGRITLA
jgi:Rieske Fe-S protein